MTTGPGTTTAGVDDSVLTGEALIPAVQGLSEIGEVPGSSSEWGYFKFRMLAIGE